MKKEDAIHQIPRLLSDLTQVAIEQVEAEKEIENGDRKYITDLIVHTPEKSFIVEMKGQSTAESVGAGIRQLNRFRALFSEKTVPLLVVPFMGSVGKQLCKEAALSWMDLSGNASIHAAGLHIQVEGRPNKFPQPGRPKDLFAPRASRVPRVLLLSPRNAQTQKELTSATGLTKGYVSKVVNRLEQAGLIVRNKEGAVSAKDPDLLLDAWAEAYEFHEHDIHKGHIAARSPRVALKEVSHILTGMGIEHAVTGLAAAWHYTAFAGFRLITFYTEEMPDPHALKQLGYRETDSGANLWLVVPKDSGVFAGTVLDDDVPFVSAVQAFLDLRGHPERASEAAEELRRKCLKWESHERG